MHIDVQELLVHKNKNGKLGRNKNAAAFFPCIN
jgi:hypothetical protein